MKQYIIDDFRYSDYTKIKNYMDENYSCSEVGDIYWIPINDNMLSDVQKEHLQCKPFYFLVELNTQVLTLELLVRTKNNIRCSCMAYATEKQRNWGIHCVDTIFEKLKIIT
jgi:hypothetical protein